MPATPCYPLDLLFRESEQEFTDSLQRFRQRSSNGYFGRINQAGMFPLEKGTSIKDTRLPRVDVNPSMQWEGIKDTLCETNLCDTPPTDRVNNPGWEDVDITLQKGSFVSDWICVDSTMFRRFASEQIEHLTTAIQTKSANEWDDKLRIEYLNAAQNKLMAVVPEEIITDGSCDCAPPECSADNIRTDSWAFVRNPDVNGVPGQINPNYLLVALDPTDPAIFERIGLLTTDMLELAALQLEYEDENRPMITEGVDLYDVLLADIKQGRDLWKEEDIAMNNAMSYGGYDVQMLRRTLGTKGVLRQLFSIRYDRFALRYWPDTAYNTALVAAPGYAFDANDPDTWARLIRVHPYKRQVNVNGGIKSVVNPDYPKAPFGISTILSPMVMEYMGYPDITSVGSATKQGVGTSVNYAGRAVWFNPDWPCNMLRNKGFWGVYFGLAVKPKRPEFGYAWLHRVSSKIQLRGACCEIGEPECIVPLTDYCFGTTGGDEAALSGLRGASAVVGYRGAF